MDQSLSDGSREVYILKCESVDMAPYAKDQQEPSCRIHNKVAPRHPYINPEALTTLSPTEGLGGLNSTTLTLPFAPPSTAFSTHLPSRFDPKGPLLAAAAVDDDEEAGGSSQIRTVLSCPHEASNDPWSGCAKASLSGGASCA